MVYYQPYIVQPTLLHQVLLGVQGVLCTDVVATPLARLRAMAEVEF